MHHVPRWDNPGPDTVNEPLEAFSRFNRKSLMKDKLTSLYSKHKAVFQRFSVLVIVSFVVSAIGFVTRVKLANELGKELFGLFAYGLAIATYTSTYVRYGMDRTLMRDLVHDREHQSQYVASSLFLRTILYVTVVIGLLTWKFFSGPSADLTAGVILLVLGQSLIGLELKSLYDSWHMMHRHAIYNLIQRCLYFGLIWGVCLFFPESLSVFWIGTFSLIAASFYLTMQCAWAFKRIDFHGVGESLFKHTWDMARNNLVIWISCMSSLFMVSFNQLMLKHYYGIDSLGGYAAAWQIVAIAMLLIGQIARIGNPTMARITKPGVARKRESCFSNQVRRRHAGRRFAAFHHNDCFSQTHYGTHFQTRVPYGRRCFEIHGSLRNAVLDRNYRFAICHFSPSR